MKRTIVAVTAVASALALTQSASAAGVGALTSAKVTAVNTTVPRDSGGFGPVIYLVVTFDRNIGTGCASPNAATVGVFALPDNAARDLANLSYSELRSNAMAALLSGRTVFVRTNDGCSGLGTQNLDYIEVH